MLQSPENHSRQQRGWSRLRASPRRVPGTCGAHGTARALKLPAAAPGRHGSGVWGSPASWERLPGRPRAPPAQLPVSCRYLISLGASLEATTDAGEKPSDLIDPEYKDLVELFQATTMD